MLTENDALQDFIGSPQAAPLGRLAREMALLSRHNQEYSKIRFRSGAKRGYSEYREGRSGNR
jgi:hypothetical protein